MDFKVITLLIFNIQVRSPQRTPFLQQAPSPMGNYLGVAQTLMMNGPLESYDPVCHG
jgi:hypothetical protein